MLIQNEHGEWEFDWPAREDGDPDELRQYRKDWNSVFKNERVNVISPWSFSYPTRIRKEESNG